MNEVFFNPSYVSLSHLIITIAYFMVITLGLLYVIYFCFTKFLFKKSKHRKEVLLDITFLWTLMFVLMVFNVYWFIFIYKIGISNFDFNSTYQYLALLPQIIIFLSIIIFYIIKRHSINNVINETSLK